MAETYIGTKTLLALAATKDEYNTYRNWPTPADEDGSEPGYLVEYTDGGKSNHPDHDGYISWTPADVFEKSYQPLTQMDFGHALVMLKRGIKVARAGWNGKGMFVYLVPAASYHVQTGAAMSYFGKGSLVPYRAYLALKTAQGDVATWQPSCSDVLADDWTIV